jgi:cytochrome c oxidase subunit 2
MMKQFKELFRFLITVAVAMMLNASATAAVTAADQSSEAERVIKITAKKFEYSPNEVRIKKGIPVVLEFTSLDRVHGFTVPDLGGIRATIEPGKATRVRILAPKTGTFEFHCDLFCGDGHEGMSGTLIVEE